MRDEFEWEEILSGEMNGDANIVVEGRKDFLNVDRKICFKFVYLKHCEVDLTHWIWGLRETGGQHSHESGYVTGKKITSPK